MRMRVALAVAFLASASLALADEIAIVGTGAGMNLLEAVAADYMKANPGTKLTVPPSIGSGGGITVVSKDKAFLGRVARPLKDSEKAMGLSYVEFAKIPVVFYAHPSSGAKVLSQSQVLDIFEGKITNWKAVGGKDLPIKVVKREKGDSSLDVLVASMKGFSGENMSTDATTQFSDQKAIQYVETTKGAIAFGALSNAATAKVTVVSIDGTSPTARGYPFLGVLALIYKDANLPKEARDFVSFATSSKARPIITKAFGIPIQ